VFALDAQYQLFVCKAELDVVSSILDLASPYLQNDDQPGSKVLFDLGCGDVCLTVWTDLIIAFLR